jgi:hypothetical protein
MHLCPKCGSKNVHRSRTRGLWEGWRQKVTGKRPYRCRHCHWRGWGVARGTGRADDRGGVPEAPNLGAIGLSRADRRATLDLDALDALPLPTDERT